MNKNPRAQLSLFFLINGLVFLSYAAAATKKQDPKFKNSSIDFTECGVATWPKSSLRNEEEGNVNFRFKVDVKGQTTEYELVKSSGFKALDQATADQIIGCHLKRTPLQKEVGKWIYGAYSWTLVDPTEAPMPSVATATTATAPGSRNKSSPISPISAAPAPPPLPAATLPSIRLEATTISGTNASARPLPVKGFDNVRAEECLSFSFDSGKLKAKNKCAYPVVVIGAVCEEQVAAKTMPKYDGTKIQGGELFTSSFGGQTASGWHFLKPNADVDPFGQPFYQTMPNGWQSRPAVVKQLYYAAFKPPYLVDEGNRWHLAEQMNPVRLQWDRTLKRLHDELGWGYSFQRWGNPGKLDSCANVDLNEIWRKSE